MGQKNGDRKIFVKVENREPSQWAKYNTYVAFNIIDFALKFFVVGNADSLYTRTTFEIVKLEW